LSLFFYSVIPFLEGSIDTSGWPDWTAGIAAFGLVGISFVLAPYAATVVKKIFGDPPPYDGKIK